MGAYFASTVVGTELVGTVIQSGSFKGEETFCSITLGNSAFLSVHFNRLSASFAPSPSRSSSLHMTMQDSSSDFADVSSSERGWRYSENMVVLSLFPVLFPAIVAAVNVLLFVLLSNNGFEPCIWLMSTVLQGTVTVDQSRTLPPPPQAAIVLL